MGDHLLKARRRESPGKQSRDEKNRVRPYPFRGVDLDGVKKDVLHQDRYPDRILHIRDESESPLEVLLFSEDGDGDRAPPCVQPCHSGCSLGPPNRPLGWRPVLHLRYYREKVGCGYRTAQAPAGRRGAVHFVSTHRHSLARSSCPPLKDFLTGSLHT